jgi:hypothetical protein
LVRGAQERILVDEIEKVPLTKIKTYPTNARRGDINAIAESLQTNAQYRPLVVQRSTGFVLAGNHTFLAAQRLGWKAIAVSYIDVNEDEARKINIADNRIPDLGDMDMDLLKENLKLITDPTGTGYSNEDLEILWKVQDEAAEETLLTGVAADEEQQPLMLPPGMEEMANDPMFGLSEEEKPDVPETPEEAEARDKENDPLSYAAEDLPSAFTLKDDVIFPATGPWDLSIIRKDMVIEEMPEPLLTWAGTATKEWPDDVWWLYNFGPDSTYGMKDPSKILLSFYAYDEFIDPWWYYPSRFMSKAINSKIKYAVTPNFSCEGMPRALSMFATWRSRWLGRYFQEVGIRVVPDLEWRVGDDVHKQIVATGLPKPLPWASVQAQNSTAKRKTGKAPTEERLEQWGKDLAWFVQTLDIQNLLVYTTENGMEVVRKLQLPCELRFCESRWDVKRRMQPPRKEKKGESKL